MATLMPNRVGSDVFVLNTTWRGYVETMKARGDRSGPLYTLLDGRLSVLSPGLDHGTVKTRLASMLERVFLAMDVSFKSAGTLTLWAGEEPAPEDRKGVEPDLCYYLRNIAAVKGKSRIVMGVDPPPHLAVEVAVSHKADDALAVMHHFRVPEVWVCLAGGVVFKRWAPRPLYWEPLAVSKAVPGLSAEEVSTWVCDEEYDDKLFLRRFDAWVAEVVRPRVSS